MSAQVDALIEAGLALSQDERALVAERLLASLDAEDETDATAVAAAWRSEVGRRLAEVRSGSVELLDGPASHAEIRATLAARRG